MRDWKNTPTEELVRKVATHGYLMALYKMPLDLKDNEYYSSILEEIQKRDLKHVTVSQTGCIGMCRLEPMLDVILPGQEKVTYVKVKPEMVERIVTEHLIGGKPVEEYTIGAAEQ